MATDLTSLVTAYHDAGAAVVAAQSALDTAKAQLATSQATFDAAKKALADLMSAALTAGGTSGTQYAVTLNITPTYAP